MDGLQFAFPKCMAALFAVRMHPLPADTNQGCNIDGQIQRCQGVEGEGRAIRAHQNVSGQRSTSALVRVSCCSLVLSLIEWGVSSNGVFRYYPELDDAES